MTVKELIEKLQQLDPDVHVFTRGYESGFEYAIHPQNTVEVVLDYYNSEEWWSGPHEILNQIDPEKGTSHCKIVKGIIL